MLGKNLLEILFIIIIIRFLIINFVNSNYNNIDSWRTKLKRDKKFRNLEIYVTLFETAKR